MCGANVPVYDPVRRTVAYVPQTVARFAASCVVLNDAGHVLTLYPGSKEAYQGLVAQEIGARLQNLRVGTSFITRKVCYCVEEGGAEVDDLQLKVRIRGITPSTVRGTVRRNNPGQITYEFVYHRS